MQIEFTPDPKLYPFESKWFDTSKGRMHYIDEGSGPTIMFFHGNPTWSFLYRNIISALRDRFRCISMDYLGFGLSERPENYGYTIQEHVDTVGELFDHLDLSEVITMGQDWGGPVSMGIATQRADKIRGVVLGNTWFWPAETPVMRIFSKVMSSGFAQHKILEKNFFVQHGIPMGTSVKLTDAEFDHYRRVQPNPEARRGIAVMPKEILAASPLLERLSRDVPDRLGDKPALLFWGRKDKALASKAVSARARVAFSDVEVVELPNARHYIQEDAAKQIADAIIERYSRE